MSKLIGKLRMGAKRRKTQRLKDILARIVREDRESGWRNYDVRVAVPPQRASMWKRFKNWWSFRHVFIG